MKPLITIALLFISSLAFANCDHPNFVTHECLDSALEGLAGQDGKDGKDGKDGRDGIDGRDGVDGKDGIVPDYWNTEISRFLAASDSIHTFLPQDKTSRLTFGLAHINRETGLGVSYAYRCHECERAPALTIGVGAAQSEVTVKASIGWEF